MVGTQLPLGALNGANLVTQGPADFPREKTLTREALVRSGSMNFAVPFHDGKMVSHHRMSALASVFRRIRW